MNNTKNLLLIVVGLALNIFIANSSLANVRIAVMDFENRSGYGGWKIGAGAADVLTTELVKGTKLNVFERDRLNTIISEQNLGNSGRVDPATAAAIGKITGVQYVVTGAVTEYGDSKQGASGKGVSIGRKGYSASVDIRIVDVETSQVIFAESGSGTESSLSLSVKGIGGGEKFDDKKASKAMREAIKKVAKKIKQAKLSAKKVSAAPANIVIADVTDGVVTLNQGKNAGISSGDQLTVKRKAKEIKDPSTGKVLRVVYKTVGKIKITDVDTGYALATIVDNSGGIKTGDSAE